MVLKISFSTENFDQNVGSHLREFQMTLNVATRSRSSLNYSPRKLIRFPGKLANDEGGKRIKKKIVRKVTFFAAVKDVIWFFQAKI